MSSPTYLSPQGKFMFEQMSKRMGLAFSLTCALPAVFHSWRAHYWENQSFTFTGRVDTTSAGLLVLIILSQIYVWKQLPKTTSSFLIKTSGAREALWGAVLQVVALMIIFLNAVPNYNATWTKIMYYSPFFLTGLASSYTMWGLSMRPQVSGFVMHHGMTESEEKRFSDC